MNSSEIREKEVFVENIRRLLISDYRSQVESVHYGIKTCDISCDEIVHIVYRGGHTVQKLVTGSSLGAIAKEVINEVYR